MARGSDSGYLRNRRVGTRWRHLLLGGPRVRDRWKLVFAGQRYGTLHELGNNTAIPELDIYTDWGGLPGQFVGESTPPDLSGGLPELGEFTASGFVSAPDSCYWAVLKSSAGGEFGWAATSDETGTGPGYTTNGAYSSDLGATWTSSDPELESSCR